MCPAVLIFCDQLSCGGSRPLQDFCFLRYSWGSPGDSQTLFLWSFAISVFKRSGAYIFKLPGELEELIIIFFILYYLHDSLPRRVTVQQK